MSELCRRVVSETKTPRPGYSVFWSCAQAQGRKAGSQQRHTRLNVWLPMAVGSRSEVCDAVGIRIPELRPSGKERDFGVGATQGQTLEKSISGGARDGAGVASDREVACGVRFLK